MQINASIPTLDVNSITRHQNDFTGEPKAQTPKPEKTEIKVEKTENIEKLKHVLAEHNITLKFRQDTDTKALIVELVDDKTGEAIRQIPSEISLKLAAVFVKLQGQFVDKTE